MLTITHPTNTTRFEDLKKGDFFALSAQPGSVFMKTEGYSAIWIHDADPQGSDASGSWCNITLSQLVEPLTKG